MANETEKDLKQSSPYALSWVSPANAEAELGKGCKELSVFQEVNL